MLIPAHEFLDIAFDGQCLSNCIVTVNGELLASRQPRSEN